MRLIIVVLSAFVLVSILCGCAALSERYSTSELRHPCGNVFDICPGDSAVLDRIRIILEGAN